MNLGERALFLGTVPNGELPAYLHISNVFCRPSLSEGLGISFIEAMAARIPVIATNVGGIPDFLEDGVTGLFCEVKNPRSIAEKISLLFNDREMSGALIENAARMVAEKYDWNLVTEKMYSIFESMTHKNA